MLGTGSIDAMHAYLPPWSALLFAVLTQFGAMWFAATILAVLYVRGHRQLAVTVAGLLVAGTGTWLAVKIAYPVPRPGRLLLDPEALPFMLRTVYAVALVDMGHRFPSGHAVTSTILYGALALWLSRPRPIIRILVAGLLIGLVGATRIALGVHVLIDVIGGIAIATAIMASYFLGNRILSSPDERFAIVIALFGATGCAIVHLAVGILDPLVFVLLGIAIGLWYVVERHSRTGASIW